LIAICLAAALARLINSSFRTPSPSYASSDSAMSSAGVRGSDVGIDGESAVEWAV